MPKQPFTFEEFQSIYSKVPRLAVEVIIQTEKGVVLTLRSIPPFKGLWHFPGGTVYYKETLEDAVKRVAREEIGVEVAVIKSLGHLYYPGEEKDRGFGWPIAIAFLCTISSGTLRGSEQGEQVGFFPPTSLPENIIPEVREFLERLSGV